MQRFQQFQRHFLNSFSDQIRRGDQNGIRNGAKVALRKMFIHVQRVDLPAVKLAHGGLIVKGVVVSGITRLNV